MSTNEPNAEKRIANDQPIPDDLPIPESPPVHPERLLNDSTPDAIYGEPPRTRLFLEGFNSGEVTAEFLLDLHDLADEHDLALDGISVGHCVPDGR